MKKAKILAMFLLLATAAGYCEMPSDSTIIEKQDSELEAQEALWEPREVTVDAHLGINIASYSSDYQSTSVKMGPMLGVGVDFPIGHTFSINPEINFSILGANVTYSDDVEAKERLGYLEIPIYAKWLIGRRKVRPIVAAAPTLGIAISGHRIYDGDARLIDGEDKSVPLFAENQEIEAQAENYRKADFGFKLKAGAKFSNGLQVLAGYQISLVNLANEDYYMYLQQTSKFADITVPDVKNRNIFVTVGYCW